LKIKIKIDYYKFGEDIISHTAEEEWEDTRFYCPNCGKKDSVWREVGPGDYYLGESYLCISCNHGFCLPIETCDESNNKQNKQIIKQLCIGILKIIDL